jgi:hypothetical protein
VRDEVTGPQELDPVTETGINNVGTVDSAVGHLARSTTRNHYFWTTSFFSDTYTVNPF